MKPTRKNTRTKKRKTSRKTADALRIIDRITGKDAKLREMIAEATINAKVAEMLFQARTKAGLTQKELADLTGTKQPSSLAWKMLGTTGIRSLCSSESPAPSIASSKSDLHRCTVSLHGIDPGPIKSGR